MVASRKEQAKEQAMLNLMIDRNSIVDCNVSKRKSIVDLRFLTAVAFPSVVKMAF